MPREFDYNSDFHLEKDKKRAIKVLEDEINEWMTAIKEKISTGIEINTAITFNELPQVDDIFKPPQCSFQLPPLQSRLEKLMGSNVVRLTDKNYMLSLRRKIQEEYEESVKKRIQTREQAEIDRQKKLILNGKMPFSDAPSELTNHPVFKITQITHQMLNEKKPKSKKFKRNNNDSKQISSNSQRLSLELNNNNNNSNETTNSNSISNYTGNSNSTPNDETGSINSKKDVNEFNDGLENQEFVFTQEQFDRLRYETKSVKYMRGLETVDEIYEAASKIVGELQLHNTTEEEPIGCTTLEIKSK